MSTTSATMPVRLALQIACCCVCALASGTACAQSKEAAAKTMTAKYAGNDDYNALLNDPEVRAKLQRLVGGQMGLLRHNLSVTGSVDLVGGALSVNGNAPHRGGEDEAVVCVAPYGPVVQAAIASKGRITVYASDGTYEYLTRCIKDWITQVNSGHRDRFQQPKNVTVVKR